MDFSRFRDYYFMRCFSKEQYRNEFNTGKKLYINSLQYFHDLDDEFQQDFEGLIFKQPPNSKGYLIKAKADLTVNEAIDKALNNKLQDGEWIIPTSDFKFYINGYIFCLTLIPKCYLQIREREIVFNNHYDISNAFYHLLNQYTKGTKSTYISLYDAQSFMEIFYPQMTSKGYSVSYGSVDYEDLSPEQRRQYYSELRIDKLVFTKEKKYDYQNEFRFFLRKNGEDVRDHIEEVGVVLQPAVVEDLVYLSSDYVDELGWKKE